jgi:hypothetical protein
MRTMNLHMATVLRTEYLCSSKNGRITTSLNKLASLKILRFMFFVLVYITYAEPTIQSREARKNSRCEFFWKTQSSPGQRKTSTSLARSESLDTAPKFGGYPCDAQTGCYPRSLLSASPPSRHQGLSMALSSGRGWEWTFSAWEARSPSPTWPAHRHRCAPRRCSPAPPCQPASGPTLSEQEKSFT